MSEQRGKLQMAENARGIVSFFIGKTEIVEGSCLRAPFWTIGRTVLARGEKKKRLYIDGHPLGHDLGQCFTVVYTPPKAAW